VQVVDLGEAERIDAAVTAVRKSLQEAPERLPKVGELEAEKELRKPLAALAEMVLTPLSKHIDGVEHWIISPDGALWLVPWSIFPLEKDRYAIEKHTINYVVSGRDLIPDVAAATRTGPALVLADPDYNLEPKEALAETRQLVRSVPASARSLELPASLRLGKAGRLPATAAEARAILPALKRHTGSEPQLYMGKQALETIFKTTRNPRIVVLSTHGFFQEGPEANPAALTEVGDERGGHLGGGVLENPLLRCGLLLAGANRRGDAHNAAVDDGVLTGLEIVGTDLRGTELVVLSACETGLGEVHNGEGVAGLRQAFQLAGARAVMATLWQIPDQETARLISDFFGNLAAGDDKSMALHKAQVKQIESRRKREGAAHPLFWAAFTLTGQ
jgi:CHAT domain-containing protein